MEIFGYRTLIAYKKAKEVVKRTYKLLKKFPAEERFAMCDQLRRASVSITSNIAEGINRFSVKDKAHFIEQRDAVQASLKAEGIPSMVYYPKPMHLQTAFASLPLHACPVATSLCDRVLSLPMHPYMTPEEIETICNSVRKAVQ